MDALVRPARAGDHDGIAEVHVTTWRLAYAGVLPEAHLAGLSVAQRAARWEGLLRAAPAPGQSIWVAVQKRRIVGFSNAGASRDEDADTSTGELRAIYLLPSSWGRGIGRALHDRAIDGLREAGFRAATLWVLEANDRGRGFYERIGWAADGTTKTIELAGTHLPEMRYRLDLDSSATRIAQPASKR